MVPGIIRFLALVCSLGFKISFFLFALSIFMEDTLAASMFGLSTVMQYQSLRSHYSWLEHKLLMSRPKLWNKKKTFIWSSLASSLVLVILLSWIAVYLVFGDWISTVQLGTGTQLQRHAAYSTILIMCLNLFYFFLRLYGVLLLSLLHREIN
jgi:hypothetical protein